MSEILLQYKRPDPTTWVYLSSFLTIGLYFVFHRFWSLRNLDIILLILLAPGLLMVHEGRRRRLVELEAASAVVLEQDRERDSGSKLVNEAEGDSGGGASGDSASGITGEVSHPPAESTDAGATNEEVNDSTSETNATADSADDAQPPVLAAIDTRELMTSVQVERFGFVWLLGVQVLILFRLIFDPMMVRRPLLDPNLTTGGMLFLGAWLFIFMMANVVTSTPRLQIEKGPQLGPGYSLMNMLPAIPTRPTQEAILGVDATDAVEPARVYVILARVLAIAAHLGIVTGIIGIGFRHFNNPRAGVGCAMLYLLMPYTAQTTGRVDHALPAALLVWAVLSYRRPFIAGFFLGAAAGLVYYPLFLLPLWLSFYWQRGVGRFAGGAVTVLVIMMAFLIVDGSEPLGKHLMRMFGLMMPPMKDLRGIWGLGWEPMYRLPILVGFMILSGFLAAWPAQKNLGTLIGCSAAMMVGAQFWHAYGGGLYIAWFLPLLLLTIFRPNLEDRVALKVIDGGRAAPVNRPRVTVDAA
jgi:hypothetical protein